MSPAEVDLRHALWMARRLVTVARQHPSERVEVSADFLTDEIVTPLERVAAELDVDVTPKART